MRKYQAANDDRPSGGDYGFNYTTSAVGCVVETALVAVALLVMVAYAVLAGWNALEDKIPMLF